MSIVGIGRNGQNLIQLMQQRRQNSNDADKVAQSGEATGAQPSSTGFQSAIGAMQSAGSTSNGGSLPNPFVGFGGSGFASPGPTLPPISGLPVSPPTSPAPPPIGGTPVSPPSSPAPPPIGGTPVSPPTGPVLPPINGTPVRPPSSWIN